MDIQSDTLTPYYDDLHFPLGFAHGHYFTAEQAQTLRIHGHRLRALWLGEAIAATDDEHEFVRFCYGNKAATNVIEITWQRYQQRIQQFKFSEKWNTGEK